MRPSWSAARPCSACADAGRPSSVCRAGSSEAERADAGRGRRVDAVLGRDAVAGRDDDFAAGAELRSGGAEHGRFAPAAAAPVNVERSDADAPLTQSTPRGADWLITAVRPLAPTQAQRTEPRNWPAGIWQTESAALL